MRELYLPVTLRSSFCRVLCNTDSWNLWAKFLDNVFGLCDLIALGSNLSLVSGASIEVRGVHFPILEELVLPDGRSELFFTTLLSCAEKLNTSSKSSSNLRLTLSLACLVLSLVFTEVFLLADDTWGSSGFKPRRRMRSSSTARRISSFTRKIRNQSDRYDIQEMSRQMWLKQWYSLSIVEPFAWNTVRKSNPDQKPKRAQCRIILTKSLTENVDIAKGKETKIRKLKKIAIRSEQKLRQGFNILTFSSFSCHRFQRIILRQEVTFLFEVWFPAEIIWRIWRL